MVKSLEKNGCEKIQYIHTVSVFCDKRSMLNVPAFSRIF
jgi:hypothetical protein